MNAASQDSLLARLLSRMAPIEAKEAPAIIAAFFLFFCFWGGYFAVRPVRETVAILIGTQHVANLWLVTWALSIVIVPLFGFVVAHVRRSVFLPCTYGLVAIVLALVGIALRSDQFNLNVGRFFYVFISVLNLFLISVFWSFLLELFDSGQAKRLFGFIAAGGTAGALTGPLLADLTVGYIGNSGVMFLGAALFVAAIFLQRILVGIWHRNNQQTVSQIGSATRTNEKPIGGNVFAGFFLILRSPYLIGMALFVVLLSTVNTILYFEQLRFVQINYATTTDQTHIFARFDWIVQSLTILSQIFLTGRIASRFGVGTLLIIVPIFMVFGFLSLAISNTFAVLAVVLIARRALEYAFARPGREILWSPLDNESRYKAKNTIDVPIYRGADALSAQANKGLIAAGFSNAAVALMGVGIAVVYAVVGWWLGYKFRTRVNNKMPSDSPPGDVR